MLNKINNLIRYIKIRSILRYILVGGLTYVLEILIIYILKKVGLNDVIAVGIAFWFGLAASFILQKVLAFSNKDKAPNLLFKQAIYYGILVAINYAFTLFIVAIFTDTFGLFIVRTTALIITTLWNYVIYDKIIFRRTHDV